ncbi:hypothetical protein PIROE2DRAFT_16093 [Piromyces sp. E2]|nr:hypothetical protein PIROE2DRAFT_16093 [Piromyces sp. E2]|eukprot:OUM58589.1 hypothetical protein PIROE2DRAFT_16093 [Piromyces sp. E2]
MRCNINCSISSDFIISIIEHTQYDDEDNELIKLLEWIVDKYLHSYDNSTIIELLNHYKNQISLSTVKLKKGKTPLTHACEDDLDEVVKCLIENGSRYR